MLKKLFYAIVAIVVLILMVAGIQSNEFTITRHIDIAKPANQVFPIVNDFSRWRDWSPWAQIDPKMELKISDPSSGPGATYYWSGNSEVGEGKMTVLKSVADQNVDIRLEFIRPMTSTNLTVFNFVHADAGCRLQWTMSGQQSYFEKIFSLFIDVEKMVGQDFEKGLAKIKEIADATPDTAPQPVVSP